MPDRRNPRSTGRPAAEQAGARSGATGSLPAKSSSEAPALSRSDAASAPEGRVSPPAPVPAPGLVFVVSHTHWDREWYFTFHRFRVHLARVVRKILEALERGGEFRHFVLDGQAVILEDHLETHPEDEGRIRALVGAGKLSIGPWYILPDEFLVSGEATVRNLLAGHKVCARFGAAQKVGYMPDSFGHIAQLPQLLRGAGIDSFIYTRGNGDELEELGYEFLWRAPDGSEVLAVNQHGGYCSAGGLGFDELWHAHTRRSVRLERAVAQVGELFAGMARLSRGDIRLLNNGCDHFPPQQEFDAVIRELRRAFPRTEFRHTGFAEYVEAVKKAGFAKKRFSGELRHGRLHLILPGVWSSRMGIKQLNDEAQTMLEKYLEPVAAYAHFCLGRPWPSGETEYAWKTLLRNHPHDSICGCSTDAVHRDMGPRFAGVLDTANQLLVHQLEELAPTFARRPEGDAATVLAVMNPLPETRTEAIERLVVLQPPGLDPDRLELVDAAGRPVPMRVVRAEYVERFWGIDYRTTLFGEGQRDFFEVYREQFGSRIIRPAKRRDESDQFLWIQFVAENLPALGHACYYLREKTLRGPAMIGGDRAEAGGTVRVQGDRIENGFCRVVLHGNGTFDLTDLRAGRRWTGLNLLEDDGDAGDEYDHEPCREPAVTAKSARGSVEVIDDGGFVGRIEASFPLPLPAALAKDRLRRERRAIACPARVRITLRHESPVVEIETSFDNRAQDHRLRAVFPAAIETDEVQSDGQFLVNSRPIDEPRGEDWAQPPTGTFPQQEFSLIEDAQGGLAVLNRGLPEIAPRRDARGRVGLALTLLRAVGWLSRDDLEARRRQNAGPTLATPEAQCPGPHRFRYAVLPFATIAGAAASGPGAGRRASAAACAKQWSQRYRVPPLVVQGVEDQHVPGGRGLLHKASPATAVSAIKKHESRDTLVVRLYNLTGRKVLETLTFGPALRAAWRTDLLEERQAPLVLAGAHALRVSLGSHEIVTLEVEFGG